jgi:ribosome-associated protein
VILPESLDLAKIVYHAAAAKKAMEMVVLDVRALTSFTDYFFICSGGSKSQVQAIAREIQARLGEQGCQSRQEKDTEQRWVLIDGQHVVCHIFQEATRKFYALEELWKDAKIVSFRARAEKKPAKKPGKPKKTDA